MDWFEFVYLQSSNLTRIICWRCSQFLLWVSYLQGLFPDLTPYFALCYEHLFTKHQKSYWASLVQANRWTLYHDAHPCFRTGYWPCIRGRSSSQMCQRCQKDKRRDLFQRGCSIPKRNWLKPLIQRRTILRFQKWQKRDPIKHYFPLPNEIFSLGLKAGEIAVYAFLLYCEDRKTFQCYPSYHTISKAIGVSVNTVCKYVKMLKTKVLLPRNLLQSAPKTDIPEMEACSIPSALFRNRWRFSISSSFKSYRKIPKR